MANENGWGDGSANNAIGWGQGANNATGWGSSLATSWSGLTNVVGTSSSDRDADAQAFITAAAITDATQQSAIDTLVTGLKTDGLWTKMKAIYPFVGGTATSHKFNLKDPRDLDAAFRLVYNGGITHSSNGMLFNGTNGYADTKLNVSTALTVNNTHTSIYSRTNSAAANCDLSYSINTGVGVKMFSKYSDNNLYFDCYNQATNRITYAMGATASTGLFLNNRTSNVLFNAWRNTSKLATNTNVQTLALPSQNIFIGVDNSNMTLWSARQYSFTSVGDGLTDTDATNLYTRVQAFQTTLSRQV